MMYVKYGVIGIFTISGLAVIAGLVMCVRYVIEKPKDASLFCVAVIIATGIGLPPFFFSTIGASIWWFVVFFTPCGVPYLLRYINSREVRYLHYVILLLLFSSFLSLLIYFGRTSHAFDTDPLARQASIYFNTTQQTNHKEVTHAT